MAQISLTDYTSQQAELARRQKLADLLSEQGQQDIPIQSYNGIQAPIPWTALLAKTLQAGAGAYLSRRAATDQDQLASSSHKALLDALTQQAQGPATAAPAPQMTAPAPMDAPAPIRNDDYAAMAAAPGPSGPSPQNIAAALGQDPTAAPAPQGAPPPAAMPPQMAQGPAAPPPVASQAPPPQMQAPAPPTVDPLDAALAQRQAEVHRLTVAALSPALSPADRATMLTQVKTAQEAVTEVQKEKFKQLADESKRQAEVQRTVAFVQASPGLTDDQKKMLAAGAAADPDLAKTMGAQMVKDAFTKQLVPAPPEMLAGYPKGTIAQMDPLTHKLENIYNPIPDLMNQARVRLEAQNTAIAGANLGLRRAEFNRDALAPPTTVEHIVNGEPVQVTAMFDKRNGRYVDMQGKPVDPTGLRVMPAGGSRATLGLLRVATAAADAATGIENLSKLPAGSQGAWFSQAANTPMGALKRVLTPQEAQDIRTTGAGLSRAMAGLATGGLSADIPTQQSFDALLPQAGQTRLTALRQMGEMRQQAENGIESALANPYITPAQKANLVAAKTKIANAVPWTPTDVSNLENSKNPSATMHGMGVKTLPTANHNPALMSAADAALAKLGIH